MSAREQLRRGWCPSPLRPMESGDGLLLRVRPQVAAFSLHQLRTIASVAEKYGSGQIDLTNRANLQVRGLSPQSYGNALGELREAKLVSDTEVTAGIITDPLTGLDPARIDVRPLVKDLEQRLAAHSAQFALPGKFGFEVSGSTSPVPGHTRADILITAGRGGKFAVRLDGDEVQAAFATQADIADAATSIAAVFVTLAAAGPPLRRMRDAVARHGAQALFEMAGLTAERSPLPSGATGRASAGKIGFAQKPFAVGIGLPFGRIGATQLLALSEAAAQARCPDVRTSKQRTLIFPANGDAADFILAKAQSLGLITDEFDPRLDASVCPGAPACRNATTDTRSDAARLIEGLTVRGLSQASVHVSGCIKGCARSSPADFTFVARNGAYDLVRGGSTDETPHIVNIAPNDMAAAVSRSGEKVAP